MPVEAEPGAATVPPAAAPVEAANEQAAVTAAVHRTPEEDIAGVATFIGLPLLGNEVGVGEQVVEDVGVQNGLLGEFLAELIADDGAPILLTVRKIELYLRLLEGELAGLLVRLDFPTVLLPRVEGGGIAVDGVIHRRYGSVGKQDAADFGEDIALAEPLDVVVTVIRAAKCELEFVGLANIEHQIIAHGCSPVCDGVHQNHVTCQRAPSW